MEGVLVMSDFFDKMQNGLFSAGKTVSDKAKNISDLTKAKYNKNNKENELKEKYAELGKRFYEEKKEEQDPLFKEDFDKIDALKKEIAELSDEEASLLGEKVCPKCGIRNKADAKFCTGCGEKLD